MVNVSTNVWYTRQKKAPIPPIKNTMEHQRGEFRSRYNNHAQPFRNISHVNDMELSKYMRMLKANGTDDHLKWIIKPYASQYKCGTRRCDLCLTEKMIIALADPKVLLNKRTELISKCRHRRKFISNSVK